MDKKLLIVVDYQKDFVDGSLGFPKAKEYDERIAAKVNLYHKNGDDVFFTLDTHHENYLLTQEGKKLPVEHCIKGTPGHDLYGKTAKAKKSTDILIEKEVFGSSELGLLLKERNYSQIEIVGIVSNICVISNAVIARTFSKESEIIVDASCTGSFDELLNKEVLDVMEGLQIKVINRENN